LKGLGEAGSEGGEAGDLLLTLRLADERGQRVVGANLEIDVSVPPWDLVDGAKVDVRGAKGVLAMNVPPGTKAGAKLRARGHGLDDGQGGRGDLYAVVRCALPDDLNERQKELLREMKAAGEKKEGGGA
jgi:DnaJ-class molecular chaperone